MADPVDTTVTRSRAKALRPVAEATLGTRLWHSTLDARDSLEATADEVDRLRAVIENAPHGRYCALTFRPKPKHTANRCTCWKADAL